VRGWATCWACSRLLLLDHSCIFCRMCCCAGQRACTPPKTGFVWPGSPVASFAGIKSYTACCQGEQLCSACDWQGCMCPVAGHHPIHPSVKVACTAAGLATEAAPPAWLHCRVPRRARMPPLPRRCHWLLPVCQHHGTGPASKRQAGPCGRVHLAGWIQAGVKALGAARRRLVGPTP